MSLFSEKQALKEEKRKAKLEFKKHQRESPLSFKQEKEELRALIVHQSIELGLNPLFKKVTDKEMCVILN